MIDVHAIKIAVPFKRKFTLSGGEATVKMSLLAIINNRYNGEASGSVYYGIDTDELQSEMEKGIDLLKQSESMSFETLEEIDKYPVAPAARAALIAAVLNYLSGESKRYPWEILNLGSPVGVKSSMTVGIDKPAEMIKAIKDSEYPIVKIKMGHEEDLMILDALPGIESKEIRVDANGGWSCAKAEEMIFYLAKAGVRIIEQPTSADFVEEWPHLKGKSEVELIMDEGLGTAEDFKEHSSFLDGVNVKMEKCGGILEAVRLAEAAREEGKKVMLGCMVESSVGIAQSVYMSSQADYFDLDGPLLLEDDVARGIRYDRETINVDREMIGGPKLRRDVVERYIAE